MSFHIASQEIPVALHPTFQRIRNKRRRWRAIRAIKRTGVTCYLGPTFVQCDDKATRERIKALLRL